jgi:hypothetical protein
MLLAGWREDGPVVIDSHAVTSEVWGLRALPYSTDALTAIGITQIVCLIADGETLLGIGLSVIDARSSRDEVCRAVASRCNLAR